jgi:hypothetical protein
MSKKIKKPSHIEIIEMARIAQAEAAAKGSVDKDIANAKTALEAYWAGSATACVLKSYKMGAVRTVVAK